MKPKVFVAQPIPEPALDILRQEADVTVYPYLDRQISVDELVSAAKRSDWLFALHETNVTAEVINANPNLKGIGAMCTANPFVDMKVANARKIPVVGEDPKFHVHRATADLTLAMLLGLAYRLVEADQYTRCGKFRQEQTMSLMGIGCSGKTVGLIGLGRVAQYMPPRLRAFGMHVIYTKPNRLLLERERALGVEWVSGLDDLLKCSDFVCIECKYNPSTHKLIGRRELDLMKPTAYLINTGRGRIIDEPELIAALQQKRIAGAALDTFWNEPYFDDPLDSAMAWVPDELCKLDNVILAPHNGGATVDVRTGKATSVAQGMVAIMRGEPPINLLNPEIYADA